MLHEWVGRICFVLLVCLLVGLLNGTLSVIYAYAADPPSKCHLALFCDADFAGDKSDAKSTTGVHLAIVGPNTYFPLSSISKKQGCVSQSTCEAEIVALSTGLKQEGLPALDFWDAIMLLLPCSSPSGGA